MNNTHNYILTGATGILGSHILYELLYSIHQNNYQGKVVLLLRGKKNLSLEQRFLELFSEEITPDYLRETNIDALINHHIQLVDFDLREFNGNDLQAALGADKYILIHCAASVNLGTNAYAFEEIRHNNYLGTLNLIHALHNHLTKVSYVSSAFSLSQKNGSIVESNHLRNSDDFRNHYEKFKVQTEQEVMEICEAYNIPCQIQRPSIICGRLVDYPHHVIPKFLVFYLFGAFFYRARLVHGDQPVRIMMHKTSGLNIVPVDYAAKAIVRALATDIKELNIVSRRSVPNMYTVPEMLRQVGYTNFCFQEEMPEDPNAVEKLYYRTVGAQLSNYLTTPETPDTQFNTEILNELMHDIETPKIEQHFSALCNYAVEREFANILA